MTTIAFIRDDEKVIADYTIDRFPELFDLLVQKGVRREKKGYLAFLLEIFKKEIIGWYLD